MAKSVALRTSLIVIAGGLCLSACATEEYVDKQIATVNELFIQTQPAYLQKLQGSELGVEERNVARASYLRSRLSHTNGRHGAETG